MAAWNDLLNEINTAPSSFDVVRRRCLSELQAYTGRNIILYYSGWLQKPHLATTAGVDIGISDADKNGFMSAIHGLDRSIGLDLLLHTPGGDMAATESLVEYMQAMFAGDIRAFVPQIAMSGGTIIALSCKQIVMGKGSSIGPIDPQFGNTSAAHLLREFTRIRTEIANDPSAAYLWQPILQKIEPGFITMCENALKWSHEMAERFLLANMFSGKDDASDKVKEIIAHLTDSETTYLHGRHIGIVEAKKIFEDNLVELESDQQLQDKVLSAHHATVITLQGTAAYKMIENHEGRASFQMLQIHTAQPA